MKVLYPASRPRSPLPLTKAGHGLSGVPIEGARSNPMTWNDVCVKIVSGVILVKLYER